MINRLLKVLEIVFTFLALREAFKRSKEEQKPEDDKEES